MNACLTDLLGGEQELGHLISKRTKNQLDC